MNDTHTKTCGCCEGIEPLTPLNTANRPGLDALAYRVGTHSSFLETMIASLSNLSLLLPTEDESSEPQTLYPLRELTTRQSSDPAIALLDGWAMVADVLAFYQERIANEGYLRTATERRSILELARLVGYKLRPGVAASTYLTFSLDNCYQVTIPVGSRAQSIPGPGELPQSFETVEPLPARAEWNELKPRLTRPQKITGAMTELYFEGMATNLKPNDPLLFVFSPDNQVLFRVESTEVQATENRTKIVLQLLSLAQIRAAIQRVITTFRILKNFGVGQGQMVGEVTVVLNNLQAGLKPNANINDITSALNNALPDLQEKHTDAANNNHSKLEPWLRRLVAALEEIAAMLVVQNQANVMARSSQAVVTAPVTDGQPASAITRLGSLLGPLVKAPSLQPANSLKLSRNTAQTYGPDSDVAAKLLIASQPALAPYLYDAWKKLPLTASSSGEIYALRTRAAVFGHNAPDEGTTILVRILREGDGGWILRTEVQIGSESARDVRRLADDEFNMPFLNAKVTMRISEVDVQGGPLHHVVLDLVLDKLAAVVMTLENVGEPELKVTVLSDDGKFTVATERENDPSLTAVQIRGQIPSHSNSLSKMEGPQIAGLDTTYGQIMPGSWVVLERPYPYKAGDNDREDDIPQTVIAQVIEVNEQSRADYGLPGMKSTRLTLDRNWLNPENDSFDVIRGTAVYAQSEPLVLTEAPIDSVAEAICGSSIEMGGLNDGLEAGRWLIISGERTDITPEKGEPARGADPIPAEETAVRIKGIPATELVMLAGVEQIFDETLPGETTHTRLRLANDLAYCYKRDTVTIYGNVAKATHGETRQEVLGSGNGSHPFQRFTLKQPPLTFVSAPTPTGVASSLEVRVNDVKWREADSLVELESVDRTFTTQTDNEEKMTLIFGDGRYGSRLPTGIENIRAVYRNGIGKMGNVAGGQISMLLTRPLGVKGVVNPLPATGGADRDSRDQARSNAPLAVMALDRLVSIQDYADFARTFAGIGKASAVRLADGRRQIVHLTIAGVGDIPIDKNSDLYRNLGQALRQFGDPYQPIQIDVYQRKLLILNSRVRVLPDYQWETVAPQVQTALLSTFSFERRELGQDVSLSEVISAIQSVRGVAYVDVDLLDGIDESLANDPQALINALTVLTKPNSVLDKKDWQPRNRIVANLAQINPNALDTDEYIQPAELIYLNPDVPDTLILTELTHG